jgi:hypothetical protein
VRLEEEIPPELMPTLISQKKIGLLKMLQGFLSTKWIDGMEAYREKHAKRQMKVLFTALWEVWFELIWTTRNHILHKTPNRYNQLINSSNENKLRWYREHHHEVLSFADRDFADHSDEAIQSMTQYTKHEWIKRLDGMSEAYQEELKCTQAGQWVITEFIATRPGLPRLSVPSSPQQTPEPTQQTLFDVTNVTIRKTPPRRKKRQSVPRR